MGVPEIGGDRTMEENKVAEESAKLPGYQTMEENKVVEERAWAALPPLHHLRTKLFASERH